MYIKTQYMEIIKHGGTIVGPITDSDTTQSTSTTTGSAIFDGGIGIAKNLYVGGTLGVSAITSTGDVSIGGYLDIYEYSIRFTDTGGQSIDKTNGDLTISSSSNLFLTGAGEVRIENWDFDGSNINVSGSAGIAASAGLFLSGTSGVFLNGEISVNSVVESTSSTTGALKVAGGLGVAKTCYIGKKLYVAESIQTEGLKLSETGAGTDTILIQAPDSISSDYILTLPVDVGGSGQCLSTNGGGVLSWATQDMQNAYNSSSTGVILLDSSTGPFVIQDNPSTISNRLLRINNSAGTELFSVNSGGSVNAPVIVSNTIYSPSSNADANLYPYLTSGDLLIGASLTTGIIMLGNSGIKFNTGSVSRSGGSITMSVDAGQSIEIEGIDFDDGAVSSVTTLGMSGNLTSTGDLTLNKGSTQTIAKSGGGSLDITSSSGINVDSGSGNVVIDNSNLDIDYGKLRFRAQGGGTNTVSLEAPTSVSTSYTMTLPIADGTAGQVLSTNGAGVLSWITV
jgi:hypothetical protein